MTTFESLIQALKNNEDIKRYQQLEKLLMNDDELKQLLESLKDVQKQFVHAQTLNQSQNERFFKEKLNTIQQQIDEYPMMSEYMYLQTSINDMLKSITDIIETGIEDVFKNTLSK